jgi:hypothetical protein
MDKIIRIDDQDVKFRATARTPRLYRALIGRDMIRDMNQLRTAYNKAVSVKEDASEEDIQNAQMSAIDLEIFENVAYIMARHANPDIFEKSPDEWLDKFNMFSIYEVLPDLLKLWAMNTATTSAPKKK